jgi:hypothetical protein
LVRTDEPVALPAAWSQVKALLSDDQVRFVTVEDGVSDYALRCGADLDDEDDQDGGGAGNDDSAAWYYYSLGYHHRIGHSCEPGFLGRRTRHPPRRPGTRLRPLHPPGRRPQPGRRRCRPGPGHRS